MDATKVNGPTQQRILAVVATIIGQDDTTWGFNKKSMDFCTRKSWLCESDLPALEDMHQLNASLTVPYSILQLPSSVPFWFTGTFPNS